MKDFFKDYSFYSVKMFVNQFAIALFGLTLSLAFGRAQAYTGQLVASICSALFYLFLIYYMTYEVGASDRYGIEHGLKKAVPLRGLYMSLLANIPNFILAILYTLGVSICGVFALVIEGMYTGIMAWPYKTIIENGETIKVPLNNAWWAYFLIIIPTLLVATISYYFGTKNIHLTPIFDPKNPEKIEKAKKK